MRFGSLFAGIGGFDLGFERAGMECAWQVEIDPFCRKVLAKHWPNVRRHDDVRTFPPAGDWSVDVICGGFPCQDISLAGPGLGLDGKRSGLWWEFHRIVKTLRPKYAAIENVSALRSRGLDQVLGALAAIGFDAEWHCVPASAVGAPHRRDRIWIVAHANGAERRIEQQLEVSTGERPRDQLDWGGEDVCNSNGTRLEVRQGEPGYPRSQFTAPERTDWWLVEPSVGRVAHGIPGRVDRLRGLGNAVVPQVAEYIARRILTNESEVSSE